jgi:hypothetical protein
VPAGKTSGDVRLTALARYVALGGGQQLPRNSSLQYIIAPRGLRERVPQLSKVTALDNDQIRARAIKLATESGRQTSNFKGNLRNSSVFFSDPIPADAATIRAHAANLRKYAEKLEALATNLERTRVAELLFDDPIFDDLNF